MSSNPRIAPDSRAYDALRQLEANPGWLAIEAHLKVQLEHDRLQLERKDCDAGFLQGRIKALREVLALREGLISNIKEQIK